MTVAGSDTELVFLLSIEPANPGSGSAHQMTLRGRILVIQDVDVSLSLSYESVQTTLSISVVFILGGR